MARVDADAAADLAAEAAEVYLAEASRCRLVDRCGPARVTVRSGVVLDGVLLPGAAPDGHLCLRATQGASVLIPTSVVRSVAGSRSGLRDESAPAPGRLGSLLREAWQSGAPLRALDASGTWLTGTVRLVGADHVELDPGTGAVVVLPLSAVEAWIL